MSFESYANDLYHQLFKEHGTGLLILKVIEEENRCDVHYVLKDDCDEEQLNMLKESAQHNKLPILLI